MKILSDTTEPLIETWDDPGDYPSNAGAGPLPSYNYIAGIEGEVKVQLSNHEHVEFLEFLQDEPLHFWLIEVLGYEYPEGISEAKWRYQANPHLDTVTLTIWSEDTDPVVDSDYSPYVH